MWHPLLLAEDFATADILTIGRVVFGVVRGYHTREVEFFGSPILDAEANRKLFEEQVEIVLKAFNHDSGTAMGDSKETTSLTDLRSKIGWIQGRENIEGYDVRVRRASLCKCTNDGLGNWSQIGIIAR